MDVFFFLQQGKEMYQTNPTQNHMGSDNWATRNPSSTILFSPSPASHIINTDSSPVSDS